MVSIEWYWASKTVCMVAPDLRARRVVEEIGNPFAIQLFVDVHAAHVFDHKSNSGDFIVKVWETGMEHALSEVNVLGDITIEGIAHCRMK